MQLIHTRLVSLMTQGRLFVETHTAIVSLQDLNLGDEQGKFIDQPIDISSPRPAGFRHEGGDIEVLNGELVSDLTDMLNPQQQVYVDVIDITSLTAPQVLVARFWYGDRAWCCYNKASRYDEKTPSWQDVVKTIMENPNLEKALANELFDRKNLRHQDHRELCSKQISESSISEYKAEMKESLEA